MTAWWVRDCVLIAAAVAVGALIAAVAGVVAVGWSERRDQSIEGMTP